MDTTRAIEIRPARKRDLTELLVLYRHLNRADPALEPEAAEKIWDNLLERPGVTIHVAELAGRLVGSCTLIVVPNLTRNGCPYALIENVVTHEAHRGLGIGHAVLSSAIDQAWRENCYKIMLMTGRKDEAINRFYEKAGFSRDEKTAFTLRRD
ncbi:GNAT family N-acetyltransferase [Microvirga sp. 2YAF29]|uniref:GNAT family N-acetyltransferase n=1 Tax=Microvirga sp. 2YAF29 TaxID=3233031 RepID=UPI003F945AB1